MLAEEVRSLSNMAAPYTIVNENFVKLEIPEN